jgi:hydrophobe/amphiphile efflux-1 (HAE1) family protein
MSITELSIKRPVLVIVGFLVLAILGAFSYTQLRYELLPDIQAPFVSVSTIYPGASPSEVETGVTKHIEDAVATIEKTKRITSSSAENLSTVVIEFTQSADGDKSLEHVQRRINTILAQLPQGVKTPMVVKFSLSDTPVLRLAARSNLSTMDFTELLQNKVKQRLAQVAGVGQINIIGGEEREIKVFLDAGKLRLRNIAPAQVVGALRSSNVTIPAGSIKDSDAQFAVSVTGKAASTDALYSVGVATMADGSTVRLADVASIVEMRRDIETINRLDGTQSINVQILKQADANAVAVSAGVREALGEIESDAEFAAQGVKFDVAQDGSEFTLAAAHDVNVDLGLAIFLVALVMFVFLHSLRNSLIVMVAIPASLLSTFIFMQVLGLSLNLLTLLAMSLVIGILVDDSIVVLENIYHHLEKGKDKRTAALDGRNEIGFAALAITLVDVVVFLPLSFVPGIVGGIVRDFALVIVISTLFSLLVCFTLTPMMASRFSKLEHLTRGTLMGRFSLWFEGVYARLAAGYKGILAWALAHRKTVIALSFSLFVGALMLPAFGFVGGEFVAPTDKGEVAAVLALPAGVKIEQTDALAREFESVLRGIPEVRKVITNVGVEGDGLFAQNSIEFSVTFAPKAERKRSAAELADVIRKKADAFAGVKARVSPIGLFGGGDAPPIQLIISGADRDSVRLAAQKIAETTRTVAGTADVRLTGETQKAEIRVAIDRDQATRLGLSAEEVGTTLRMALAGFDDLKFQRGTNQYPIRIQFRAEDRTKTDFLKTITFTNARGERVELARVATITQVTGFATLERKDRANAVTLFSQAVGRSVGDVGADMKEKIDALEAAGKLPSGVRVLYGGDLELQGDAFGKLALAFGAAILFMYLVMVALYNSWISPFIVLFSIPVAVVGALLALALTGNALNIFSILGMIMMTGLVAKNAILIVDRANENLLQGSSLHDSLMEAGVSRLRPILMTTLAMIIGMLPIALAKNAGGELKTGLGWALIGGLTSSMFLSLVLVPAIYFTIQNLRRFVFERLARFTNNNVHQDQSSTSGVESVTEPVAEAASNGHFPKKATSGVIASMVVMLIASNAVWAQDRSTPTLIPAFSQREKGQDLMTVLKPSPSEAFGRGALEERGEGGQQASIMAANPLRISLADAVKTLRERNPDVLLANLDAAKADERLRESRSELFPTITAQGNYQHNFRSPVFFLPQFAADADGNLTTVPGKLTAVEAALRNGLNVVVALQMPVYNASVFAGLRAAALAGELTLAQRRTLIATKTAELKRAYYNVLIADEQRRLTAQNLARAEETIRETRSLLAKGLATDNDTLRAFVAAQSIRPQLTKATTGIAALKTSLALLMGLEAARGKDIELTDSLVLNSSNSQAKTDFVAPLIKGVWGDAQRDAQYKEALQTALTQRPEAKQLTLGIAAANAQIEVEQTQYLPSLAAFGQFQGQGQSNDLTFSPFPTTIFAGLQLNWTLFNGFKTQARVAQAQIALDQNELQLRTLQNGIAAELQNALDVLREAEERISTQTQTVAAAERNYAAVKSRFRAGVAKQLDVSDAFLMLAQNKTAALQAMYDYLLGTVELERVLGQGAE